MDSWHGCRPYLVSASDGERDLWWEWDVDPYTRRPIVPAGDLQEVKEFIQSADVLAFQNSKFDMQMLDALARDHDFDWEWQWPKIHELGISSHLLASSQRKDLTTLALVYCGINLEPFEKRVQAATEKARRIVRSKAFIEDVGLWLYAKDGLEGAPSGVNWKTDMWLLRAMFKHAPQWLPDWEEWESGENHPEDHPWLVLCEEYANADPAATLGVFNEHQELLARAKLMDIYEHRRKLLPITYNIERVGVTVSKKRTQELRDKFAPEAKRLSDRCLDLADGHLDKLPVSGRSNALSSFVFDELELESPKKTKKGLPAMDKEVLAYWLATLRPNSKAAHFIGGLQLYRKYMTAIGFMNAYDRFGLETDDPDILLLHPSLNMVGTSTLRWSSSNPNEQNVSKQDGYNLRYTFGPPPGYLWATLDYENLELRIPAYESGEQLLIDLFEYPDLAPFYGSSHMVNFSVVYPDIWEPLLKEVGPEQVAAAVKERHMSWYKRCKNGGFAIQYGAVEIEGKVGTADRAFGREGCHRLLKERFSKQEELNKKCIDHANRTGYVETIPDRLVDPNRGYPLQCKHTKWGKVKETIPLSYHVQGTAVQTINAATIEVDAFFQEINRGKPPHLHWNIVLQVHDELGVQFPRRPGYKPVLAEVRRIMESCGEDRIGIPLRVGCDLHQDNWAEGLPLDR